MAQITYKWGDHGKLQKFDILLQKAVEFHKLTHGIWQSFPPKTVALIITAIN